MEVRHKDSRDLLSDISEDARTWNGSRIWFGRADNSSRKNIGNEGRRQPSWRRGSPLISIEFVSGLVVFRI